VASCVGSPFLSLRPTKKHFFTLRYLGEGLKKKSKRKKGKGQENARPIVKRMVEFRSGVNTWGVSEGEGRGGVWKEVVRDCNHNQNIPL